MANTFPLPVLDNPTKETLLANGVHLYTTSGGRVYYFAANAPAYCAILNEPNSPNTYSFWIATAESGHFFYKVAEDVIVSSSQMNQSGQGFYYAADATVSPTFYDPNIPIFESFAAITAYFAGFFSIPKIDVGNLSGIFCGSTEIQKVILNGATIYQKAAAGFQVTVQAEQFAYPRASAPYLIYDGQSDSAPLVLELESGDFDAHNITISSGFMYITPIDSNEATGTVSGGVTKVSFDGGACLYAVSGDGSVIGFASYCLTGDSLVTMADGTQKRLDEIEIGDSVLSLDWETKDLIARKVIFTDKDENKSFTEFDRWIFADGTEIKTVHRHEFYNVEKGRMAYMDTWEIGDHAYRIDGSKVELVGHETVKETVKHYKITLEGDTNYFVHGLLNGDRNCPKEKL